MNLWIWQSEMQRQNAEMMAFTPSQIRDMYRDRAEMRAKWLLLGAQDRDEREVKKSAAGSAVRHVVLSFIILALVLATAVLQYAVAIRRLALNNIEANYSSAVADTEKLAKTGKNRYILNLYDLMRDASSFSRIEISAYFPYKDEAIFNPNIYGSSQYAAAYDSSGECIARLGSFINAGAVIRIPDDFPDIIPNLYRLSYLSFQCLPEEDGTYTAYECTACYSDISNTGRISAVETIYKSKSIPDAEIFKKITYYEHDFTILKTHLSRFKISGIGKIDNAQYAELFRSREQNGKKVPLPSYSILKTSYINRFSVPGLNGSENVDVFVVSQFSPVGSALMSLLAPIIISLVLFFTLSATYIIRMRRYLVKPMKELCEDNKDIPMWREAAAVRNKIASVQDKELRAENEITRLNTALDYAKEAEENRRVMVSNIAHELKTPLAVVHGYAEGLRDHIAEDKREQYLDTILSETERMDAMVHEMLDLSRLEAGKVKLSRDEFSLTALAKSVFDRLSPLIGKKKLIISIEAEGECSVVADEARIGQVVTNLASNAVKYTPESGEIRVKIDKNGGKTRFSIENTAVHFTEEELLKVWDTFYRGDKSRHSDGTGLGLAITKNIVELHGGSVSVRNTDAGVEFGFELG